MVEGLLWVVIRNRLGLGEKPPSLMTVIDDKRQGHNWLELGPLIDPKWMAVIGPSTSPSYLGSPRESAGASLLPVDAMQGSLL